MSSVSARVLATLLAGWRDAGVAYAALADRIRLLILDGRVGPGTRLPAERELAAQLEVSRSVLREIGADSVPSRLVLNKIDRVTPEARAALAQKHPDAILLSAHNPADVAALRETIIAFFEASMVDDRLTLPYAKQGLLGEIYESARVLSEDYDEKGRILNVRGLPGAIARLRRTLAA